MWRWARPTIGEINNRVRVESAARTWASRSRVVASLAEAGKNRRNPRVAWSTKRGSKKTRRDETMEHERALGTRQSRTKEDSPETIARGIQRATLQRRISPLATLFSRHFLIALSPQKRRSNASECRNYTSRTKERQAKRTGRSAPLVAERGEKSTGRGEIDREREREREREKGGNGERRGSKRKGSAEIEIDSR